MTGLEVYVATEDTFSEGSMLLGVYSAPELAREACELQATHHFDRRKGRLTWPEPRHGRQTSEARGCTEWTVTTAVVDEALT